MLVNDGEDAETHDGKGLACVSDDDHYKSEEDGR